MTFCRSSRLRSDEPAPLLLGRAWHQSKPWCSAASYPHRSNVCATWCDPSYRASLLPKVRFAKKSACCRWPHPARTADALRAQLRGSRRRLRVSIRLPCLCSIESRHPSSRPASWQSAARSGSQGCAANAAGIGGAGAKRPRQSEHGASLPWRNCTTGGRGVSAPLFCSIIGGRSLCSAEHLASPMNSEGRAGSIAFAFSGRCAFREHVGHIGLAEQMAAARNSRWIGRRSVP